MNVSLTNELAEFVKQQVESGMYQTASEVMRDGVRLLQRREQLRQIQIEELRKQVAIGIEQMERGEYFGIDEVFEELRTRNKQLLGRQK